MVAAAHSQHMHVHCVPAGTGTCITRGRCCHASLGWQLGAQHSSHIIHTLCVHVGCFSVSTWGALDMYMLAVGCCTLGGRRPPPFVDAFTCLGVCMKWEARGTCICCLCLTQLMAAVHMLRAFCTQAHRVPDLPNLIYQSACGWSTVFFLPSIFVCLPPPLPFPSRCGWLWCTRLLQSTLKRAHASAPPSSLIAGALPPSFVPPRAPCRASCSCSCSRHVKATPSHILPYVSRPTPPTLHGESENWLVFCCTQAAFWSWC